MIQFVDAKKVVGEITLFFTIWPSRNFAKVKKIGISFKNGTSGSTATNELFSRMSRYVQQREQVHKQ